MSDVEELKKQLSSKVLEVLDLCDLVMKEEQHVGVLEVTTMLCISALYAAEGRVRDVNTLKKEDMVFPLPKLREVEAKVSYPEELKLEPPELVREVVE